MLAYELDGEGPPLLLLPGMTSREVWDPVLGGLTASRRVIRVDYPGFGASPQTDPPTPAATATAVTELLDHIGLERVAIAGHSLGGWVGLELAKRDRAEAVLALAPAGLWRRHSPRVTDFRLNLGMAASRAPRWLRALALKSPPHRYLALRDQSARR
jgi:pimeloyl-ACP methyl ester carboxylesterase